MADSNAQVGITIVLSGDDLGKLTKKLVDAERGTKKTGDAAKKSTADFSGFGRAIIVANQAIQLAERVFGALEHAVTSAVAKSLEFRFTFDPIRQSMTAFDHAVEETQAHLGDQFLPLLLGIAKAFTPILASLNKWINANQAVIQTPIIEWTLRLASILTHGLAGAIKIVGDAFTFFSTLENLVYFGMQKAASAVYSGVATIIEALRDTAIDNSWFSKTLFGVDGVNQLSRAASKMRTFATVADNTAEFARKSAAETSEGWSKTRDAIDGATKAIDGGLNEAAKAAYDRVGKIKQGAGFLAAALEAAGDKARIALTRTNQVSFLTPEEAEKQVALADKTLRDIADHRHRFRSQDPRKIEEETAEVVKQFKLAIAARDKALANETEHLQAQLKRRFSAYQEYYTRVADLTATSANAQETEDEKVYAKANNGVLGLVNAWKLFTERRKGYVQDADGNLIGESKKTEEEIKKSTQSMIESIADSTVGVIQTVRGELARIGEIETETQSKIALKAKDGKILRYVDQITKAQIDMAKRAGQTVEVVTDTMEIKTRNAADAIESIFSSLADAVIAQLERIAAIAVIGGIINVLSGGGGGFAAGALGAVTKAFGAARGGLVPQYLGSGGSVLYGPRGTDTVPAWLTPGEFVVPKPIVDQIRNGSTSASENQINRRLDRMESHLTMISSRAATSQTNLLFGGSKTELTKFYRDSFKKSQDQLTRLSGKGIKP